MSTLRVGTFSNAGGSASVPADTVISGTAKAWVNFNGTGTVAIREQFNVSSITDNGTGQYSVNFLSAMPNTNYSVTSSGAVTTTFSTSDGQFANVVTDFATGSFRVRTLNSSTTVDNAIVCVSVFL